MVRKCIARRAIHWRTLKKMITVSTPRSVWNVSGDGVLPSTSKNRLKKSGVMTSNRYVVGPKKNERKNDHLKASVCFQYTLRTSRIVTTRFLLKGGMPS